MLIATTSTDDMSTFRKDRSFSSVIMSMCFKFRILLLASIVVSAISLCLLLPAQKIEQTHSSVKNSPQKKLEKLEDFSFALLETKWIASGRKTKRIHVTDKADPSKPLSYGQVLQLFQTNAEFRDDFFDNLRRGLQSFSDGDINSYFFETPPVTHKTKFNVKFEFVLIAAPELNDITADPSAFEKHLTKCRGNVIAFPNLGNDATLIAPCRPEQYTSLDTFAHLANFMRTGSYSLMHDFWIEVGRQMEKKLEENPEANLWMSTSGTGIFWLHLRLDTKPKYYTFPEYRKTPAKIAPK